MADEPKPDVAQPNPGAEPAPSSSSVSPTSADAANAAPATGSATPVGTAGPQPDPLSDGTKPTILAPGESHHSVAKDKTSIARVYRRADILTTLFTFLGAMIAAGIILGVYAYLTRSNAPTIAPTKVTTLDKSELEKLDTFFSGNSAGKSSEILTISSSSLFKNRVAISSDLKVVGGLQVSAPTALADLTVDKTSTLGVTNVRGALSVIGPLTVQNAALFNAGA